MSMADKIIDYARIYVVQNRNVRPVNTDKLHSIDAKPGAVRLYRDMSSDPSTLVVDIRNGAQVRDIPWDHVATAIRLRGGEVVQLQGTTEPDNDNADADTGEPEPPAVETKPSAAQVSVNAAGEPTVTLTSNPPQRQVQVQRGGKR